MRASVLVLFTAAIGLAAASAPAQGPKKPKGPAASAPAQGPAFVMSAALAQKLRSADEAEVRAALDDVRMAGKPASAAVPEIAALLHRGGSLALTEAALDTLGDLETESASDAVAEYTAHRNVKLRRSAVRALGRTKGPAAVKALRRSLSDSDAMVRGSAAAGLGALRAKEAVPDLFVALDHKLGEAAASIGQVCTPQECEELTGKLGKLPFDVVTTGLDPMLFRPQNEVSDDAKVKVVGRIRELGTMEANKFLRDVQKRWPATWSQRVKQSIDQGVLATAGGSQ